MKRPDNCKCPRVRHFRDGSTSTADPNGRWVGLYVCTDCGLSVFHGPKPGPACANCVAGPFSGSDLVCLSCYAAVHGPKPTKETP